MRFKGLIKLLIAILIIVLAVNISSAVLRGFFPKKYTDEIEKYSAAYGLDPHLVMSVIKAESNYDENAVSHKDACGLMQLTQSTANWLANKIDIADYTKEKICEPEINIRLGCYYLAYLYDIYENEKCMLAAYNAGNGTVDRWLSDSDYSSDGKTLDKIPYKETEQYVNKVNSYNKMYSILYRD